MTEPGGLHFTAPGAIGADGTTSPLDALRALVAKKVERPPITIHVLERTGWKIRCNANIPAEQRRQWVETYTTAEGRLDGLGFACVTLASLTEAIIDPTGIEVTEEGGTNVTFKSKSLQEWMGVTRPVDAVRAFFGVDPHVDDAASKVYEAAGYYDEVPVDPTTGSLAN